MTKEIAEIFEARRKIADELFKKRLRGFMTKYHIPLTDIDEIGVITQIDYIQEARHEMILWNERWREELRDE